jgi:hypothetical protein
MSDDLLARLTELEKRQRDQADVIAGMADLGHQVHQVSELVAELAVRVGDSKPGRMPRPTPQWHALTTEELGAELHKLRGYEKEILPLLGHLAKIGDCWPQHPLACICLEIMGEIWQCLFQTDRRPPSILHGQADFMIRVLPGLLGLISKETTNCAHQSGLSSFRAGVS